MLSPVFVFGAPACELPPAALPSATAALLASATAAPERSTFHVHCRLPFGRSPNLSIAAAIIRSWAGSRRDKQERHERWSVAAAAPGVQVCRMAGLPERAQGRTKQQRSRLHGPPHWRCEWLTRLVYSEITRSSHRLFAPGKMDLLRVRPVFRLTINPRAQPTCTCCRCARSAGSRRSGVPSALFLF